VLEHKRRRAVLPPERSCRFPSLNPLRRGSTSSRIDVESAATPLDNWLAALVFCKSANLFYLALAAFAASFSASIALVSIGLALNARCTAVSRCTKASTHLCVCGSVHTERERERGRENKDAGQPHRRANKYVLWYVARITGRAMIVSKYTCMCRSASTSPTSLEGQN